MLSAAILSSSEDEELENAEINALRREVRLKSNIYSLPSEKFVSYFRLNKTAFKYVLDKINSHLPVPKKSTSTNNVLKLALTMRILAEGSYQKGAGNDYNICLSQPAVSKTFHECIEAMFNVLCPLWILFPTTDETAEIKGYFYRKTGFPGVIGLIDGTHVKIIAPASGERSKFFNRKGFFSLNVAVVCDHQLRIRYISSFNPGASHDSLIWNVSDLRQLLRDRYQNGERNSWLLGDAGYPLEPFLITPFRAAQEGSRESRFNSIHASTRNGVERCIGVLKNRFRGILGARQLHFDPHFAGKITAVCASLHNICIHYKIDNPEVNLENEIIETAIEQEGVNSTAIDIRFKILEALNM